MVAEGVTRIHAQTHAARNLPSMATGWRAPSAPRLPERAELIVCEHPSTIHPTGAGRSPVGSPVREAALGEGSAGTKEGRVGEATPLHWEVPRTFLSTGSP